MEKKYFNIDGKERSMKSLFKFLVVRRVVSSNVCVALCGGSFIGGVLFNTLGTGGNLRNAVIGGGLAVFFWALALIFKGGE